jgi:hypothetical protein
MTNRLDHDDYPAFSVDDWGIWLNGVLNGYRSPYELGHLGEDKSERLIRFFRALPAGVVRDRFGEAATLCLECTETDAQHAERLFVLLQLTTYVHYTALKRIVRRLVFEESLKGIVFARQNLHIVALVAASEFDVDDELIYYLDRTVNGVDDFRDLLCYWRIYSYNSAAQAADFLKRIIPVLDSEVRAKQAVRQLSAIMSRKGSRETFVWHQRHGEKMRKSHPAEYRRFSTALRSITPEPTVWSSTRDGHLVLLSAALRVADIDRLKDVEALAGVVATLKEGGEVLNKVVTFVKACVSDPSDPAVVMMGDFSNSRPTLMSKTESIELNSEPTAVTIMRAQPN